MACKVGYKLPEDKWWHFIRTLGNGINIDEAAGQWPNLHMSWMPIYTSNCILCANRAKKGQEPLCVLNCPTKALIYGDLEDPESMISVRMEEMKEKGYRVFQLPKWEQTRSEIYYSKKV
jgi:Fe-S-cluster-containing dehydrogenase component